MFVAPCLQVAFRKSSEAAQISGERGTTQGTVRDEGNGLLETADDSSQVFEITTVMGWLSNRMVTLASAGGYEERYNKVSL